jgi:hypothetical protein
MSKMGSHDPFEYLQYKLWLKERSKVKVSIWVLTIKSQELPWITCVHVVCHMSLKSSQWGLQLYFRPHFNRTFAQKIMGFQNGESPNFKFFGIVDMGIPKKWHLGAAPVTSHKKYYKKEGGDFPHVWAVVNLVNPCMPMVSPCTKSAPTMFLPICCLVCANPYK